MSPKRAEAACHFSFRKCFQGNFYGRPCHWTTTTTSTDFIFERASAIEIAARESFVRSEVLASTELKSIQNSILECPVNLRPANLSQYYITSCKNKFKADPHRLLLSLSLLLLRAKNTFFFLSFLSLIYFIARCILLPL